MKFSIQREDILKPLQAISGVVERRQTLPVLSNVLLNIDNSTLTLSGTDLEVELKVETPIDASATGDITLPARKFLDICRALPDGALVEITIDGERANLRSGKSRFTLSTLPASEFPNMESVQGLTEFSIPQSSLKELIEKTQFSMAQQDVRYYLNGLMLEISSDTLRSVATDGHRLALCEMPCTIDTEGSRQIIIPRKGVGELSRLLDDSDTDAHVRIGTNHIRVTLPNFTFTSKLIDGRFPDYQRVVPQDCDKSAVADRNVIRSSLTRASILSNEKYRGVRLQLNSGSITVMANNPELEEAEEEFEVDYDGAALEIGFNVTYIIDALNVLTDSSVVLNFSDANSSCLISGNVEGSNCKYVVMPMRL